MSIDVTHWSRNDHFTLTPSHPLYLFLHGFIPNDLIHPFTFHIKGHKKIKPLFLSFINNLSFDIRSSVWKNRNAKFKEWKKQNNLTKNSFKSYKHHKTNTQSSSKQNLDRNRRTNNPSSFYTLADSLRQRSSYVAFIYTTSSNFLHNGPWYNHICTADLNVTFNQLCLFPIFYDSLSG
jgi:hypothetical protein